MLTEKNTSLSDSDVIIVFVNFSKQNSFVVKAYFTPALDS